MLKNTKKPLILKRMIIKPGTGKLPIKSNVNQNLFKVATIPLYREDVIYESKGESYIGDYQSVTIMNKLNNLTNNCQTIAQFTTKQHEIIVKTSDHVTEVIGHEAYNTLFYALCSVINQEYRIKGILSLLTAKKSISIKLTDVGTKACQTDETRIVVKSKRPRKRVRKQPVPYAVKPDENIKKLTVIPENCVPELREITKSTDVSSNSDFVPFQEKTETLENEHNLSERILPDLGNFDDTDSLKSVSGFSCKTSSVLMVNPLSMVDNVEKHIQEKTEHIEMNNQVVLTDGTEIKLRFKPEDVFHMATAENLQYLDEHVKKRLLLHQMHIDFKYCLKHDEDGNLPIHDAVINDDIPLLKRQCAVLNIRKHTVDIPTTNGLTALKLSLFRESAISTSILLSHGADPFLDIEGDSTCAHIAAELKTEHLAHILNHCKLNARNIIIQHVEELQTPGWEQKTDDELSTILLNYLCSSFDKQGYTPLMLASNLGLYENTRLLLECSPQSVDLMMPTCGNTALFLAVAAACTLAVERGNKSKIVDHFRKTVEFLLDFGANPSKDNNYGSNVNMLLQEFNCSELSMLVANRITFNRFTNEDTSRNFNEFFLLQEGGTVSLQEIRKSSRKFKNNEDEHTNDNVTKVNLSDNVTQVNLNSDLNELVAKGLVKLFKNEIKTEVTNNKPIITENIILKPNDTKIKASKSDKAYVKMKARKLETVSLVRKVIWCHPKRKCETNDDKDPKMKKA